ncbi:MAG TPA: GTP pyrophosphokinase [Firmicutes bacterium]|nr:GTP pyrophosphokinase [Bacillota bacterium]
MNNILINEREVSELMLKYNFALQLLETQFNILIKEFEFKNKYNPVEHMKSRLKTEKSIIDKLNKKGYEVTTKNMISHVHDIIGIRIVCSFLEDVYDIVDIIKSSKQFKIKEEKDYIKNPKSTGYMSYHLIVLVPIYLNETVEHVEAEIQIRTSAMDFWASIDHKVQYKFPSEIPEEVKKEMYNCSLDIRKLDEKMQQLNEFVNKYNKE